MSYRLFVIVPLSLFLATQSHVVDALGGSFEVRSSLEGSSVSTPCAVRQLTPQEIESVETRTKSILANKKTENQVLDYSSTIDVYWHTITNSNGVGLISQKTIDKQIKILNNAFKKNDIGTFVLKSVDVTNNDAWWNMEYSTAAEANMKMSLRKGDKASLNYYSTLLNNSVLGWSTYPWDIGNLQADGVVCTYDSIDVYGDYTGDTAVHEVGHWLGLYHTFEGGCNNSPQSGDRVTDTPAVSAPNYGCPTNRDSCPDIGGVDMVNNFMDYTSDACKNTFTEKQFKRMKDNWISYRAPAPNVKEDAGDTSTQNESSVTADFMSIGIYAVVAFVGVLAIIGAVFYRKKRQQDELDALRLSQFRPSEYLTEAELGTLNPVRESDASSRGSDVELQRDSTTIVEEVPDNY